MFCTKNFITLALALLLFLLLVDNDKSSVHGYDYCSKSASKQICPEGIGHFTCYKNEILPSRGKFMAHVPFTNKIIRTLLQEHNELRNSVASGNEISWYNHSTYFTPYPKAARMRELVWDHELAYLARQQAGQCNILQSVCHNSKRHPHSGQNLDVVHGMAKVKIATVIKSTFIKWFSQKDFVDTDDMVFGTKIDQHTKEFALLVNEHASHVGCAISYCTECDVKRKPQCISWQEESQRMLYFPQLCLESIERLHPYAPKAETPQNTVTAYPLNIVKEAGSSSRLISSPDLTTAEHCYNLICNYNTENVANRSIYTSTDKEPANDCASWNTTKSSKYPNLCANTGRIFDQTNLTAHT